MIVVEERSLRCKFTLHPTQLNSWLPGRGTVSLSCPHWLCFLHIRSGDHDARGGAAATPHWQGAARIGCAMWEDKPGTKGDHSTDSALTNHSTVLLHLYSSPWHSMVHPDSPVRSSRDTSRVETKLKDRSEVYLEDSTGDNQHRSESIQETGPQPNKTRP